MTERNLADMMNDLRQTQQAFLGMLSRADHSLLYQRPADGSWTLAQVLVHVTEARRFFAAGTREVLATPGIQMGRTVDHPGRLQNIIEHAGDPPDAIRSRLITSHQDLLDTLQGMTTDDLQVMGGHVKHGPQSLREFIEHFVVEHDQAHVQQASALLAGATRN
ncbi:MAG: DinB family protein [Chloroflexi bacterium]|nr:DinB family protein [Chloroflexota bacterium]